MKHKPYILKHPLSIFVNLGGLGLLNWINDERYLKIAYYSMIGRKLDLNNPKRYNEKLQWLKLYDRRAIYTTFVDKYEVKNYVASVIGKEYVIPTIGVWDSFEDIDFNSLPNKFVLKCTHDSGGLVIVEDKNSIDLKSIRKKINKCLKKNYFWQGREWPYKNVKPRIIAEVYMEDSKTSELRDYKFFAFDGKVKALFVGSERQNKNTDTKFDFFDADYQHLDIINGHSNAAKEPDKPLNFDLMKELASKLSVGYPHIRVDFYEVNNKVYFGELTLFHHGGFVPFEPDKWDFIFGDWINIE